MTSHQRADYYSPQAGSGQNLLDTCGAIKEQRTAFPAPNKELSAKPKNNRLTGKAPYKSVSPVKRAGVDDEPRPAIEAHAPLADALVADHDRPHDQDRLNITQAQTEQ